MGILRCDCKERHAPRRRQRRARHDVRPLRLHRALPQGRSPLLLERRTVPEGGHARVGNRGNPPVLAHLQVPRLVLTVVDGIVHNLKSVLEAGKRIVDTVKDGFLQKVNEAKQWGADLIKNFIGGITQKVKDLKNTVSGAAQAVKDFLGFSEPKLGPLSNFHTYAPDMMELFAEGIKANTKKVTDQIEKSFDFGEKTVGFGESAIGASIETAINTISGSSASPINFTVTLNLPDGTKFASYYLPSFIDAARANGTPILNPS